MRRIVIAAMFSIYMLEPATAQIALASVEAEVMPDVQAVFVAGTRDPDWKTYKAFIAGMTVFDEQHKLAPTAELRFVLRPRSDKITVSGVKMTIETDDFKIAVPVETDGTFVLPRNDDAAEKGAEIMLSKKTQRTELASCDPHTWRTN